MFNLTSNNASHLSSPERGEIPQIHFESAVKPSDYAISYIAHPSIMINTDDQFSNYSFSGVGSELEPYLIENYNITTTNTTGILIQNTSKFFKIKNCVITAEISGIYLENITSNTAIIENNICNNNNRLAGIFVREAPDTLIANNTCEYNNYGMRVLDSNNIKILANFCRKNPGGGITIGSCLQIEIKNNEVLENGYSAGIVVADSNQAIIENNTCIDNALYGIELRESSAAVISKNYVVNNNYCTGIMIYHSFEGFILNNTIFSDKNSIRLADSTSMQLENNKLYYSGLEISVGALVDFSSFDIQNNFVNDKELGFFINVANVKIKEPVYGQLILVNCQEVVVENQGADHKFIGVTLHYCNSITLQQLSIISSVKDVRIRVLGIRIYDSENINVFENVCKDGGWGILLRDVKDSVIKSNLCENNYMLGIVVSYSVNIALINNTCLLNKGGGIILFESDGCDINFNYLEKNGNSESFFPGLRIDFSSDHNIIHHNIFIDNIHNGSSQAVDDGEFNIWFDVNSQEGNFWNDYSGVGPYLIYGYSNSTDPYPLSKIPVYSDFNYKNFYYFFLVLVIIPAYGIFKAGKFLKEIRID